MITFLIAWFSLGLCTAIWFLIETVVIDKQIAIGDIAMAVFFMLFGTIMLQNYSDVIIYKRKVK